MNPPCDHWRDNGKRRGGECSLGVLKNPSFGTCMHACGMYKGPDRTEELIQLVCGPRKTAEPKLAPIVRGWIFNYEGRQFYWRVRVRNPFYFTKGCCGDTLGRGCGCPVVIKAWLLRRCPPDAKPSTFWSAVRMAIVASMPRSRWRLTAESAHRQFQGSQSQATCSLASHRPGSSV